MVGVRMAATGVVRRQWISRVCRAVVIGILQSRLPAVSAGNPSEEVIEAAILHGHNDHVLDADSLGPARVAEPEIWIEPFTRAGDTTAVDPRGEVEAV